MFLTLATSRLTASQVQHRCNDLKSLEYMLLYFLRGCLLWQSIKTTNQKQKKKLILTKKKKTSIENLCKSLSREFDTYFKHVYFCSFDEKSRYFYLYRLFRSLFVCQDFDHDYVFDWTILKFKMASQ